ncbi:MAG TPA: PIG-L family deacetylase [Gemmataceae bacterium]|nr:PIG-L family deacetylase [Gemmataceae bacterium]
MSNVSDRLDIVAVAPHPDDLELTCGGTLAKLVRQGYRVGIIDLTTGEPTPRGSEETRAKEAEAARRVLGVHVRVNLGLPNRVLMDSPEGRFRLATELRRFRPDVLITISGRTPAASPDHHQAHLLAEAGRFFSQLTRWDDRFAGTGPHRIGHLVYAPTPFDAEQRLWHSTFVIDVTDTFEQKLDAVRCYESQFDAARFEMLRHFLSGRAAADGARCGFKYGELFALPHPVGAPDLVKLVRGATDAPPPKPGQGHLPMG